MTIVISRTSRPVMACLKTETVPAGVAPQQGQGYNPRQNKLLSRSVYCDEKHLHRTAFGAVPVSRCSRKYEISRCARNDKH